MRRIFIVALLVLAIAVPGLAGEKITGYGDHSFWVVVDDFKKTIEKNAGIDIELLPERAVASKGCAKGILHASRGRPDTDFGLVCCGIHDPVLKEYGLVIYPVLKEPLAIIVHRGNPVKDLSTEQVRGIFRGRITNWKQVGGPDMRIIVVTRLHCQEHVPNWTRILGAPDEFTPGKLNVTSEPDVWRTVGDFRGAVGHLETTSVFEAGPRVKPVSISGHMPTSANLAAGKYPFWTSLSVVTKGEAKGDVLKFIKYMRGDPGMKKRLEKFGIIQLRGNGS